MILRIRFDLYLSLVDRSIKHNDWIINSDLTQRCLYHQKIKEIFLSLPIGADLALGFFFFKSFLFLHFFSLFLFFFLSNLWMSFEMLENEINSQLLATPKSCITAPKIWDLIPIITPLNYLLTHQNMSP